MKSLREVIREQFAYCIAIAEDIVEQEASLDVLNYAKKYAEIESPMTGEIEVDWIRIMYGDIYIFLHLNEPEDKDYDNYKFTGFTGEVWYQLDGLGQYGGETIDVKSQEEFLTELGKLTEEELDRQHYCNYEDGDYSEEAPGEYVPMKKSEGPILQGMALNKPPFTLYKEVEETKIYRVMVASYGYAKIEAKTKTEALEKYNEMSMQGTDAFEWSEPCKLQITAENEMNFEFYDAVLPYNDKEDFKGSDISENITCRICLSKAPNKKYEYIARSIDGENYKENRFFIEATVMDQNGGFMTSDWYLGYTAEDGEECDFGYIADDIEYAWEFFKRQLNL